MPILPDLRKRAVAARELMDDPNCDPQLLARTFEQFQGVNRLVAGWKGTYRERIRPLLSATTPSTLIDVGCGGGDIARDLARWAKRDGLLLDVTGIDPDPRAIAAANRAPNPNGVTFLTLDSSELVDRAFRFDFVISNHVLHHLSPQQLTDLLIDCELLCRGLSIHSDIRRSRLAYLEYWAATLVLFRGSFVREDGLTSIRRSYTTPELRVAARREWNVESQAPFRNLLTYAASAAARETEPSGTAD
ncbi:class I SAM-dependent methyltransferase [Herbiconiux sp. KACC 21604]|uniref:class I SAM-dependent methyltransferase n=1 Tax=unclassified Herbiconiux TaxID=2618217 RepID=UPI0014908D3E|nr:class I SAM-dependent methyltransferase [Herbiconiux sp. SALV-R1]QJU53727.1 methyltransferase domain-containing protein [Herbiconiux sp. SALV-R1]WPO84730.1 class I SAM-dependent methyltransferase [Herbiconiux sp. KACC 21604]